MTYIIDHATKFIHERAYSEKRCGIEKTSNNQIELTDSTSYITQLEKKKFYTKCPYCHEIPLLID